MTACLARGWLPTGGGQLPYVALFARGKLRRKQVDAAIARGAAVEITTVRSTTMLVGADDVPLALAAGRAAFEEVRARLEVAPGELARLGDAIVRALEHGPMDAIALRGAIDPKLVRDLGEAGRRRGFTSTLPLAMDALHVGGRVRRAPGRLDDPRPTYATWTPSPGLVTHDPAALVARYLVWAAPATAQDVAWWCDLGVRETRTLLADAPVIMPPRTRIDEDAVVFLPFRDNYTHLHRELAAIVDPRDAQAPVLDWARGTVPLASAQSLHQHAIVAGGLVIGVWDYDADARALLWATFSKPAPARRLALDAAAAEMAAFLREDLGDLRYYALDSAANRAHRLAYLRAQRFRGAS